MSYPLFFNRCTIIYLFIYNNFIYIGLNGVLGPLRLSIVEQIALVNIYIPWAKENGKNSRNLITF